ncbi:hypothetical protein GCM10010305_21370 [Streptomyces termitum]|uniref:Uncharacterized protein n=1 Tax=Streptomyces termitum TaxID=67368 RepID=A0A918SYY9_9ACTN|nr:hypothetical protein GCM10010305_21370 [Streptomyces termitum]
MVGITFSGAAMKTSCPALRAAWASGTTPKMTPEVPPATKRILMRRIVRNRPRTPLDTRWTRPPGTGLQDTGLRAVVMT